tara:strand:+ start:49 stop:459 length:411 start_codon:yes stop_codon:yes gene_type:complete
MTTEQLIRRVTNEMEDLLISKNKAYGDSATNPSNIFSKGSAIESLCARIDDKLMRIKNKGINDQTEDTVSDLIGYLILLRVSMIKNSASLHREYINEEYEEMAESVRLGGFANINGTTIDNLEDLQVHYDNLSENE